MVVTILDLVRGFGEGDRFLRFHGGCCFRLRLAGCQEGLGDWLIGVNRGYLRDTWERRFWARDPSFLYVKGFLKFLVMFGGFSVNEGEKLLSWWVVGMAFWGVSVGEGVGNEDLIGFREIGRVFVN